MLEDRRSEVLRALVEEHIRTGEPVGSRTLLAHSRLKVSPATVRKDLAALEREGFVVQPHTSAGRVPTSRAYRYYVEHLNPGRLRATTQAKIADFFGSVHLELSNLLKATSNLLAEITNLPAVVVGPGITGDTVSAVHLILISTEHVLVIVVTEGGRVIERRARLLEPATPGELDEAQRIVAQHVVGRALSHVAKSSLDPADIGPAVRAVARSALEAISDAAEDAGEIYVGGTQRLASVWEDLSAVQRVLDVLEREAEILKLLAAAPGTSIQFGPEIQETEGVDMAIVSKTYDVGASGGSLGVIGPMRMNYKRAITAVEEVSKELEDQFNVSTD